MKLSATILAFAAAAAFATSTTTEVTAQGGSSGRPFTAAKIDASATYAQHFTQAVDGSWNAREVFKLCPMAATKGKRGENIKYAAVAVSKECPE